MALMTNHDDNDNIPTYNKFYFHHPCPVILSGPTQCGKTKFLQKILDSQLIQPFPDIIYYCYSEWQPIYEELKNKFNEKILFIKGILDTDLLYLDDNLKKLVVFDDLMRETSNSQACQDLFTKLSHHRNTSVFLITHNVYNKGECTTNLNRNSHYLVLFKNPRDRSEIRTVGSQMFPYKFKFLVEAYQDACSKPYGYLVLDFKQTTPEQLQVQTGIFEGDENFIYLKKT